MKKKFNYNTIVFLDKRSKKKFLIKSNLKSKEKININNNIYLLKKIEISSNSHPIYNKNKELGSITGRIEKFKKKYNL